MVRGQEDEHVRRALGGPERHAIQLLAGVCVMNEVFDFPPAHRSDRTPLPESPPPNRHRTLRRSHHMPSGSLYPPELSISVYIPLWRIAWSLNQRAGVLEPLMTSLCAVRCHSLRLLSLLMYLNLLPLSFLPRVVIPPSGRSSVLFPVWPAVHS